MVVYDIKSKTANDKCCFILFGIYLICVKTVVYIDDNDLFVLKK